MSPSEADLRAALRDGDGDGELDVDRIIAGGQAAKAQRRARMLTTAAVTVLVAGLGAGGAVLASNSGGGATGSSRAGGGTAGQKYDSADAGGGASGPALSGRMTPTAAARAKVPGGASAVPCPASLPDYRLPGGGSPGQFGADGPLFSHPVDVVVVCAYGPPSTAGRAGEPDRVVLAGASARTVADSLEQAPRTKPTGACPYLRTADARALAIIGVADGKPVGTITTTVGTPSCSVRVTNGTALRYRWTPPQLLRTALAGLTPIGGRSHGPIVQGSPGNS